MSLRHVLAAASILLASFVAACSNQAEGERCDRLNNDDDCQEGLVCKPGTELGSNADTCCPPGASELPECTEGGGVTASTGTGTGSTGATAASSASSSGSGSSSSSGEGGGTGGSNDGGGGTSNQGGGGTSNQGGGGASGN